MPIATGFAISLGVNLLSEAAASIFMALFRSKISKNRNSKNNKNLKEYFLESALYRSSSLSQNLCK
jgi:mannose/fructose/N-acetylgalactosamine-specific phosphotransferase system component IIC